MRALALLAGILAFAVITDAPAKIYKWVDNEGQVHYGQQPPNGVDAEPMSVHTAPASKSSSQGSGNGGGGGGSGDGQSAETAGSAGSAGNEDAVEENCRVARQNLNILETAGPGGRFRQPDGEVVRYDEEQWQSRVDQNRKYIEAFCEDDEQ